MPSDKHTQQIRRGGRAKLPDAIRKEKRLTVRIDPGILIILERKLREAQLTVSEYIRLAIVNAKIIGVKSAKLAKPANKLTHSDLINLIIVGSEVKVEPRLTPEENECFKKLYGVADDIRLLIDKGVIYNEKDAVKSIGIYEPNLQQLLRDFAEIKSHFMQIVQKKRR